jgi:hypothetical protein
MRQRFGRYLINTPCKRELSLLDGSNGFKISGTAGGDNAGWQVAPAGDVNGDPHR